MSLPPVGTAPAGERPIDGKRWHLPRDVSPDYLTSAVRVSGEQFGDKYYLIEISSNLARIVADAIMALYTGQRRGDLIKMTRADYNGREIAVVQNKTGEKVWIPAHASLRAELEPINRFMLLATERGKTFTARRLSAVFLDAIRLANLNGLTLHGLRVTAATWMAAAGCSDAELQTILGHKTVAMATKYRRLAEKRVMAASAIAKLERLRPKV